MVLACVNAVSSCHVGKGDDLEIQAHQVDVEFLFGSVAGQEVRVHDTLIATASELDVESISEGDFHVVLEQILANCENPGWSQIRE